MDDRQNEESKSKYKNQYRIPSTRLPDWDYASGAYYFVTICIQHREPVFGKVINDKIITSALGQIAQAYWLEIPKHHKNVELDVGIVMPTHVHGIIIKTDPFPDGNITLPRDVAVPGRDVAVPGRDVAVPGRDVAVPGRDVAVPGRDVAVPGRDVAVPGRDVAVQRLYNNDKKNKNQFMSEISPKAGSLGAIIRSYKSAVTRWAHENSYARFAWQARYYEHIIRNDIALERIRKYILNNPLNWLEDPENPDNRQ